MDEIFLLRMAINELAYSKVTDPTFTGAGSLSRLEEEISFGGKLK